MGLILQGREATAEVGCALEGVLHGEVESHCLKTRVLPLPPLCWIGNEAGEAGRVNSSHQSRMAACRTAKSPYSVVSAFYPLRTSIVFDTLRECGVSENAAKPFYQDGGCRCRWNLGIARFANAPFPTNRAGHPGVRPSHGGVVAKRRPYSSLSGQGEGGRLPTLSEL